MNRTTLPQLPDSINCSSQSSFTQVPNDILRNPKLSAKAKTIISLLLSNRKGWHSSVETLKTMMKEGEEAIYSALKELEESGFLKRIKYRDSTTKVYTGQIWLYTDIPFEFNVIDNEEFLIANNIEIDIAEAHSSATSWKARSGKATSGFSGTNNTNSNNTIFEEYGDDKKIANKIPPKPEWVAQYCKLRNNGISAERFIDFYTAKNWMIGKNKMKDWQAAVRTWEQHSSEYNRVGPGQFGTHQVRPKRIVDDGIGYHLGEDGLYRDSGGNVLKR